MVKIPKQNPRYRKTLQRKLSSHVIRDRDPTSADYRNPSTGLLYEMQGTWKNSTDNSIWILTDIASNLASWELITTGSGNGTELQTDDGAPPVIPDGDGVIGIVGGTGIVTSGQSPATSVTISADTDVATTYTTDSGSAAPASNNLNILGQSTPSTTGIRFTGSGSTIIGSMYSPFAGDFTFTESSAANVETLTVSQTDNTNTESHARVVVSTGGASGGNPYYSWSITGAQGYSLGAINSVGDRFFLYDTATLGSGNILWDFNPTVNSYVFGYGQDSTTSALELKNTSNTDSKAKMGTLIGASSAGAAYINMGRSAARAWSWGLDANDSDTLKLTTDASSVADPQTGTTIAEVTTTGVITTPKQPCFLATGGAANNVLGNSVTAVYAGANAALTEEFDQGSNFTVGDGAGTAAQFAAPEDGKYLFCVTCRTSGYVASTNASLRIDTTGGNYLGAAVNATAVASSGSGVILSFSQIVPMSATDTATFRMGASGEAGDVVDITKWIISGSKVC